MQLLVGMQTLGKQRFVNIEARSEPDQEPTAHVSQKERPKKKATQQVDVTQCPPVSIAPILELKIERNQQWKNSEALQSAGKQAKPVGHHLLTISDVSQAAANLGVRKLPEPRNVFAKYRVVPVQLLGK